MKIYVAHSNYFDFKTELYSPLRNSDLNKNNEIILPHETDEFINSKEIINKVDVVIAEVSFPATGEGIELGWAESFGKKVICIYKEGSKISGSLKVVSETFLSYSNGDDMIKKLTEALTSF